jgi:ribosomal protein S18 acetylase RimI-like enzyme
LIAIAALVRLDKLLSMYRVGAMNATSREWTTRRAQPSDRDELVKLMLEYTVDFYKHPVPETSDVEALFERMLGGREGIQFVADSSDGLIGFATVYFSYDTLEAGRIGIMHDLYLVERARGSGAAEELFRACRRFAAENGCRYMSWETAPDNHRAQRFYAKMGGTRAEWVPYSIGVDVD